MDLVVNRLGNPFPRFHPRKRMCHSCTGFTRGMSRFLISHPNDPFCSDPSVEHPHTHTQTWKAGIKLCVAAASGKAGPNSLVSNPASRLGVRLGFNIFASFVPKATWCSHRHTCTCAEQDPFTLQVVFFPFAGKVSPFASTFWDGVGRKVLGFFGAGK